MYLCANHNMGMASVTVSLWYLNLSTTVLALSLEYKIYFEESLVIIIRVFLRIVRRIRDMTTAATATEAEN